MQPVLSGQTGELTDERTTESPGKVKCLLGKAGARSWGYGTFLTGGLQGEDVTAHILCPDHHLG